MKKKTHAETGPASWKWRIYKADLTQAEFCQRFDVWQGHLTGIIKGRITPTQETTDKIEKALKALGV